ncbi:MAG: hypothetical protein AAGB07_17395 [Pseudomonadota bacterium]
MPEDFVQSIFTARLIERFALTGLIALLSVVIMVAFWRSMTKLDFELSNKSISLGSGTVIATPILALGVLTALAWASFSNPISLSTRDADGEIEDVVRGMVPNNDTPGTLSTPEVSQILRLINCAETSSALVIAETTAPLKRDLMRANWDPVAWGNATTLDAWLNGDRTMSSAGITAFQAEAPGC